MTNDESLLLALQAEFFTDPDGVFEQFLEALSVLRRDAPEGLRQLLKVTHSLKGTAQAIGLKNLAGFVNAFEESVSSVQVRIEGALEERDLMRIHALVNSGVRAVESLFQRLREGHPDDASLGAPFDSVLRELSQWRPGPDDGDWGMGGGEEPVPASVSADAPKPTVQAVQAVEPPSLEMATSAAPQSEADVVRQFLLLEQRGRMFAIPVSAVVEILERRPWCALPVRRRGVLGVMNRFGEVLPVLDFQGLVGIRGEVEGRNAARGTIVVCRAGRRCFGFPVDGATQIVDFRRSDLQSASLVELRKHNGLVTDMALLGNRTVLMVDLDRFVEQT